MVGGFAIGTLIVAAFVWYAYRARQPLLDPRLFAHPTVRAGTLGVAACFFGLFGLFYVNAQYLQDVKGYSALGTGLAIAPLTLAMIVVSPRSVGLAARFGARRIIGAGLTAITMVSPCSRCPHHTLRIRCTRSPWS